MLSTTEFFAAKMMKMMAVLGSVGVAMAAPVIKTTNGRFNEVWTREQEAANGVVYEDHSM